jgi:hypothetical protein
MKARVGKNMMFPADDEAMDWLVKKPMNDVFEFEPLNPRSLAFNNYIHAAIDKVAKAHGVDLQTMKARLLIATGRYSMVKVAEGKRVMVLPSTSKASWTMKQMIEFWDDARQYIIDHLLSGISNQQVTEIRGMLNEPEAVR